MLSVNSPLSSLFGVSAAREKMFAKLGIKTFHQLVSHYPRKYEFRGNTVDVCDLVAGEVQSCILSPVTAVKSVRIPSKSGGKARTLQSFIGSDGTGNVKCTFFNHDYLSYTLGTNAKLRVYGKVICDRGSMLFSNPQFEIVRPIKELPPVIADYPLTAGLTDAVISNAVSQVIDFFKDEKYDILTKEQQNEYDLCSYYEALCGIHFPKNQEDIDKARKRLAFDELLLFQLNLRRLGAAARKEKGMSISLPSGDVKAFASSLPFELTAGQKKAVNDIAADMKKGSPPMRRLIQGDVGCGKTIVAAMAVYLCAKCGRQSALMAPTEILATQHFESLEPLFAKCGISCALLCGSTPAAEKRKIKKALANGDIDLLIGTHAIIEDTVQFASLSLVITDEQHRFGVKQREKLESKISSDDDFFAGTKPHMLVMSATPIPRTLALMLYGDLDITVISDKPAGRKPVRTVAVGEDKRERLNGFIEKTIDMGHQVYVVCPLVKDPEEADEAKSEKEALKSVEAFYKTLCSRFSGRRVGFMYGQMKPADKDKVMGDFAAGSIDILVSTTVIEVGVNVPNATLMIIENAERFGLSQLHQLRGRVGRGKDESCCVLVSDILTGTTRKECTSPSAERLNVLCDTNDGFVIAEKDLDLRGPGEFFGERQHGEMKFRIADVSSDMELACRAGELAEKILSEKTEHPVTSSVTA